MDDSGSTLFGENSQVCLIAFIFHLIAIKKPQNPPATKLRLQNFTLQLMDGLKKGEEVEPEGTRPGIAPLLFLV